MSTSNAPNGAGDNYGRFGTPPPEQGPSADQEPPAGQGPPAYQGQPYGQPYPAGSYGTAPPATGRPPAYLPWAVTAAVGGVVFSLILGFPAALVATRYARKVKTAWDAGDPAQAATASKRALTWSIVATCLDLLGLILVVFVLSHPAANTG